MSWSIYGQIRSQPDLGAHLHSLRGAMARNASLFWAVVALMVVNWGLETRKWQVLLRELVHMPFFRAFKAILSGLAFAMNTPNRVGEYGGRVLYVPEGMRLRAVSLTLAGSLAQLLVTMVMGSIGLTLLRQQLVTGIGNTSAGMWIDVFRTITAVCALLGMMLYFRLGWLVRMLDRIPGSGRVTHHVRIMGSLTVSVLLRVLSLSVLRFLVFGIQYILMLQFLQVNAAWWPGFWMVSVLFLLLAMVPTIALLELGLRWRYSLVLFGVFSPDTLAIYAAATGIWLVNLVVPALAGSLFIIGVRVFRDRKD